MTPQSETEVVSKHLCFKPSPTTNAMLDVVEQMLAGKTWGDEFAISAGPDDRSAIGTAFKLLLNAGLIERTGALRRSRVPVQKGRVCWQYSLPSASLARTFLSRHERVTVDPQLKLL